MIRARGRGRGEGDTQFVYGLMGYAAHANMGTVQMNLFGRGGGVVSFYYLTFSLCPKHFSDYF